MELNNNDKQERTSQMQRKVLEHLTQSGNVSYACKRAGINRDTYYAWKQEDKVFAHDAALAVEYGKSFVNDLAHTQLIANIQKGDMRAVRFQLISCHEDYKPRRARAPEEPEQKLIPVTTINVYPTSRKSSDPSNPPERDEKKPKPASRTDTKPASPVLEPESDSAQFLPPRRRGLWNNDDDDGWEIDGDLIWGKRKH